MVGLRIKALDERVAKAMSLRCSADQAQRIAERDRLGTGPGLGHALPFCRQPPAAYEAAGSNFRFVWGVYADLRAEAGRGAGRVAQRSDLCVR